MFIDGATLAAFALLAALANAAPGPNMLTISAQGARGGPRGALAALGGVSVGALGFTLAAAAGLGALMIAAPMVYEALRWAGVAYLLYTAFALARAAWRPLEGRAEPAGGAFTTGLASSASNPKTWIYYTALLPSFADPARGPVGAQIAALGLVDLAISIVIYGAAGLAAARAGGLAHGRWTRALDGAAAVLFAAYGIGFAVAWMR